MLAFGFLGLVPLVVRSAATPAPPIAEGSHRQMPTDIPVITWLMGRIIPGFTSIVASIWLLGGFTISMLGIIGIYLSKIFTEVKNRPYSIVRKEWDHSITQVAVLNRAKKN